MRINFEFNNSSELTNYLGKQSPQCLGDEYTVISTKDLKEYAPELMKPLNDILLRFLNTMAYQIGYNNYKEGDDFSPEHALSFDYADEEYTESILSQAEEKVSINPPYDGNEQGTNEKAHYYYYDNGKKMWVKKQEFFNHSSVKVTHLDDTEKLISKEVLYPVQADVVKGTATFQEGTRINKRLSITNFISVDKFNATVIAGGAQRIVNWSNIQVKPEFEEEVLSMFTKAIKTENKLYGFARLRTQIIGYTKLDNIALYDFVRHPIDPSSVFVLNSNGDYFSVPRGSVRLTDKATLSQREIINA